MNLFSQFSQEVGRKFRNTLAGRAITPVLSATLLFSGLSTAPGQTIQNPSFESPAVGLPLYENTISTSSQQTSGGITGWTVSENTVVLVNPEKSGPFAQLGITGTAADGDQAVNLASGVGRSAITQSITVTNAGTNWITFSLGTANTSSGNGDTSLEVVFGNEVRKITRSHLGTALDWDTYSLSFVVTTGAVGNIDLTFRSDDDPFDSVTLIDNVLVSGIGGVNPTNQPNVDPSNGTDFVFGESNVVITVDTKLPGNVAPQFDPGLGFANVGANPVMINKIEVLNNGRIIVGGSFATYQGVSTPNFARIDVDGSLDNTFFHGFGASSRVNDLVVQNDGRIVVVGAFDAFNEIFLPGVARILADGGPDRSFTPGNGANGEVRAVALQSDERIIVGGSFTTYDGVTRSGLARILASGKIDTSFAPGSGFDGTVHDLIVLSDDRILAAGSFNTYNTVPRNGLVLINQDGSLDATFIPPFESSAVVEEILVQADGKIVAVGSFSLTGSNGRRNVARLNTNGSLDTTFGSNSVNAGANDRVNAVEACADGSLVVVGEFTQFDGKLRNRIAKLNPLGFLDNSSFRITSESVSTDNVVSTNLTPIFTTNFPPSTNLVYGFNSNALFLTLTTNTPPGSNSFALFTTNTVVSTNNITVQHVPNLYLFGLNGGADSAVHDLALNSTDTPYIGGAFSTVNGKSRPGLAQLYKCSLTELTSTSSTGPRLDGVVVNATTGNPINGAVITTGSGSAISDAAGRFSIPSTTAGTNYITLSATNFAAFSSSFILTPSFIATNTAPLAATYALSPLIADTNTVRLVLTWGAQPLDLDSHLDVPATATSTPYHVDFIFQGSLATHPFASLDVDDTVSYGPETITITNFYDGVYNYYIHNWTGFPDITTSGAEINVFTSDGLIGTIPVPSTGNGLYWHVMQIDGSNRTFAVVNTITNVPPVTIPGLNYLQTIPFLGGSIDPTLTGAPEIAVQPQDAFDLVGGDASLTVAVNGTRPFHYQWQHNGQPVSGATSSRLDITNLAVNTAGDYRIVVTNILGAVTSRVAQVTALSPTTPFVFLQPHDLIVDEGATASFEILAGGERPLFYQWRHNGLPLPNQTGPLLSLPNVVATNTGAYEVIVANAHDTILSRRVQLSVATPPVITDFSITPSNRVRVGDRVNLSVGVEGKAPFEYRWLFDGQLIPGAVASNLIFSSIKFTNAGDYTVVVTNALGAATNIPVAVTVDSPPIITTQPQNQFQTIGRRIDLTVESIGSPTITRQWYRNGTALTDETGGTLTITNLQQENVGLYTVVLTNDYGSTTSRLARVEVVLERALLPWVKNLGGAGSDSGRSIAVDASGAVYTVGTFEGSATFGTNTLISAGRDDIFLVRFSESGSITWARAFGGPGYDAANDIAVTTNGDIFITGYYEGVASFGGRNLTNSDATTFSDLFVARFDNAGNTVWLNTEGAPGEPDEGTSIALAGTNVYVAGRSAITDFDGASLPAPAGGRILLASYDSDGKRLWARKSGADTGNIEDTARAIATDASGNVFLGGEFSGSTLTTGTTNIANRGFSDGFVAKYDATGTPQWLRQIGAEGQDSVRGLAIAPDGTLVVAGQFSRIIDIGASPLTSTGGVLPDAFVAKLDANGTTLWAQRFGGPSTDGADDVAVDPHGNIYVTGSYQGAASFGDKSSVSIADTTDVFALRLRPNGSVEFVQQAGGDDIGGEFGHGIAVDEFGNAVFTGSFRGTLVAGGNSATSSGEDNAFVSRLVSPPNMQVRVNGNEIILSWPGYWPGFLLEVNGASLNSTNWTTNAQFVPTQVGNHLFLTNTATTNIQFFRLRRP